MLDGTRVTIHVDNGMYDVFENREASFFCYMLRFPNQEIGDRALNNEGFAKAFGSSLYLSVFFFFFFHFRYKDSLSIW